MAGKTTEETFDFENWTEEDERKALDELRAAQKVKTSINAKARLLGVKSPSGRVYAIPLSMTLGQAEEVERAASESDSDGMEKLLGLLCPDRVSDLKGEDMAVVSAMFEAFMGTYAKLNGVASGE